jgi:hypothetical protein
MTLPNITSSERFGYLLFVSLASTFLVRVTQKREQLNEHFKQQLLNIARHLLSSLTTSLTMRSRSAPAWLDSKIFSTSERRTRVFRFEGL